MIGLFVDPGVVPAPNGESQPRFNRSYEYDAFSSDYVRFLIEELIPVVAKDYKLSDNPDHRAICGASSGGIAAFNAAWQRPDAFHRAYSMIGTFVGLRGGDEFATLVRKTEPKPLRIFLQDGKNDFDIYCGDWWMENQKVVRALKFSGYEIEQVWALLRRAWAADAFHCCGRQGFQTEGQADRDQGVGEAGNGAEAGVVGRLCKLPAGMA